MPSSPQVTSDTAIAERFAPSRDVSFEALEAKKPNLKPFTATLPWHDAQRGENIMLSLSGAASAAGIAKSTIWRHQVWARLGNQNGDAKLQNRPSGTVPSVPGPEQRGGNETKLYRG